jgi:hypothetical protein
VLWHKPSVADAGLHLGGKVGAWDAAELTVCIAFANLSTRSNTALGITSQGFSDVCEIPLAARPEKVPA